MEKCVACQYYDRENGQASERGVRWGKCRRSGPMVHPTAAKTYLVEGIWPSVRDDDWCGQFNPDKRRSASPESSAMNSLMAQTGAPTSRPLGSVATLMTPDVPVRPIGIGSTLMSAEAPRTIGGPATLTSSESSRPFAASAKSTVSDAASARPVGPSTVFMSADADVTPSSTLTRSQFGTD